MKFLDELTTNSMEGGYDCVSTSQTPTVDCWLLRNLKSFVSEFRIHISVGSGFADPLYYGAGSERTINYGSGQIPIRIPPTFWWPNKKYFVKCVVTHKFF
jgi:hypothetical protein